MNVFKIEVKAPDNLGHARWSQAHPKLLEIVTSSDGAPKQEFLDFISWESKKFKTCQTIQKAVFRNVVLGLSQTPPYRPCSRTLQHIVFEKTVFQKGTYLADCPKLFIMELHGCSGVLKVVDVALKNLVLGEEHDAYCLYFVHSRYEKITLQGTVLNDVERTEFRKIIALNSWDNQPAKAGESGQSSVNSSHALNLSGGQASSGHECGSGSKLQSKSLIDQIRCNSMHLSQPAKPAYSLEQWAKRVDQALEKELRSWVSCNAEESGEIRRLIESNGYKLH